MNITTTPNRIHPLLATAAVSVTLVSLVGIAALTDMLPKSHSTTSSEGAQKTSVVAATPTQTPLVAAPVNSAKVAVRSQPVVHKATPVHVKSAPQQVAVPSRPPAAPVAQNSPIGIGVGAVVGGLLGNQVGGGNGKTLATIAGAVGGGYLGNEIAKKNQ